MPIELPSLDQVDPDLVLQELTEATEKIQEAHPELELRRGVFHDLVLYFHAVLAGAQRTMLNRYLSARSLRQIEADPSLADEGVVDDVLSNWGLTRIQGTKARGYVVIVLSTPASVTIGKDTVFKANGLEYLAVRTVSAVSEEALLSGPADVLMHKLASGNYAFTVEVEAAETGDSYALSKDDLIQPSYNPASYVTSYAASNFEGGSNTETNLELIQRLQQGIAAKGGSNRINMAAFLRATKGFESVPATSIVGYGSAEMLRDRHSIIPISYGGRVDWYIRGAHRLLRSSVRKTCTLVEKNGNQGTWQFSIASSEYPGFYEVRNIRPEGSEEVSGGFQPSSDVRTLNMTGGGFIPDMQTLEEGVYSAYQAAVIRFVDTQFSVTDLAVGATRNYDVEVVSTPLVGELQELMTSFETRHRAADILVKAAVPCFVRINFTIYRRADEPDPDLEGIKQSIVDVVNRIGFIGRLYASRITDTIHSYLMNDTSVGELDLFGRIRRPNGTTLYLRDGEVLRVTDDPAAMVTANTVQFFLEPEDIGITVETGVPMPV